MSDDLEPYPDFTTLEGRRDRLAAIQHDIWREDMRTLLALSTLQADGASVLIPAELVGFILERVTSQYAELSPRDQELARLDAIRLEGAL